ncbi:unnamed protein product [Amoebophrya sp. A25]|nr:unnamed protein product [Amoebophrya sp. A25]|eukprot:GSA25T00001089001.1
MPSSPSAKISDKTSHDPLDDAKLLERARESVSSLQTLLKARSISKKLAQSAFVPPLTRSLKLLELEDSSSPDRGRERDAANGRGCVVRYVGEPRQVLSINKVATHDPKSDHVYGDDGRCHTVTQMPLVYSQELRGWILTVRVDNVREDGFCTHGVTLGFTRETPADYSAREVIPDQATQLMDFCGIGFDGRSVSSSGRVHDEAIGFHPSVDVRSGAIVSVFLSSVTGEMRLLVLYSSKEQEAHSASIKASKRAGSRPPAKRQSRSANTPEEVEILLKHSRPSTDPNPFALQPEAVNWYGVVELRGNCLQVSLLDSTIYLRSAEVSCYFASRGSASGADMLGRVKMNRHHAEKRFARMLELNASREAFHLLQARGIELQNPKQARNIASWFLRDDGDHSEEESPGGFERSRAKNNTGRNVAGTGAMLFFADGVSENSGNADASVSSASSPQSDPNVVDLSAYFL